MSDVNTPLGAKKAPQAGDVSGAVVPERDGAGRKVWVVARYYNYEGYAKPEDAFETKADADAWIAKNRHEYYADDISAVEIPVHPATAKSQESTAPASSQAPTA